MYVDGGWCMYTSVGFESEGIKEKASMEGWRVGDLVVWCWCFGVLVFGVWIVLFAPRVFELAIR